MNYYRFILITLSLIIFGAMMFSCPNRAQVTHKLNQAGVIEPRVKYAGFGYTFTGYRALPDGRKQRVEGEATTERIVKLNIKVKW